MQRTRRTVLAAAGAGLGALAGCAGGGDDGGDGTATETPTATATAAATTTDAATPTGDGTTAAPGPTAGAESVEIPISGFAFDPVRADVPVGGTVVWENEDGASHDVVSAQFHDSAASWEFQSATLAQGDTTSRTFESAGAYQYYCSIHGRSSMCGVVLVGDASVEGDMPCE